MEEVAMDFRTTAVRIAGIASVALLVLAGACSSTAPARSTAPHPGELGGTQWAALLIDDQAVPHANPPTIEFGSTVTVRGYAGCNSYFGEVRISARSMRFLDVGQHLVGCEPRSMEQEQRFMAALVAVRSYRLESGRLVLLDAKKIERLLLDQRFPERMALNGPPRATRSIVLPPAADAYASSVEPAGPLGSVASISEPRSASTFGLELVTLTAGLGEYFGAEHGALVVRAPSENVFTLKEGDVIVAVNGRQPANGAHGLRILGSYRRSESLHIELIRKHQPLAFDITLPP
jgi:heat shock protein HslJ